jgi:hypothetical protein
MRHVLPGEVMSSCTAPTPDSNRLEAPMAPKADANFMLWSWTTEDRLSQVSADAPSVKRQAQDVMRSAIERDIEIYTRRSTSDGSVECGV